MKKLISLNAIKHSLFFIAIIGAVHSYAQNDTNHRDTIIIDPICSDCAEYFAFGGRRFLETFLDSEFYLMLKNNDISTGEITLSIMIDTLGVAYKVELLREDTICKTCNEILLNAITSIRRWKPDCKYDFDINQRKMLCNIKTIILHFKIVNSNIYINGRRERRLLFRR